MSEQLTERASTTETPLPLELAQQYPSSYTYRFKDEREQSVGQVIGHRIKRQGSKQDQFLAQHSPLLEIHGTLQTYLGKELTGIFWLPNNNNGLTDTYDASYDNKHFTAIFYVDTRTDQVHVLAPFEVAYMKPKLLKAHKAVHTRRKKSNNIE